ncbi:hypothetical protein Tco_1324166, partial [Tanacetum coccineum]
MNKTWWRSSLEYFHNVSNASASSHGPLKTKNSRLKRKAFISHTHVCTEVFRETSSIRYDSPLNNVFSDTMEFDHDSFSRFTKNPDNRAAHMNKITDMKVEFHRHLKLVEECIDVDLNPYSCGSDNHVELGDKESMYVDRDVK